MDTDSAQRYLELLQRWVVLNQSLTGRDQKKNSYFLKNKILVFKSL